MKLKEFLQNNYFAVNAYVEIYDVSVDDTRAWYEFGKPTSTYNKDIVDDRLMNLNIVYVTVNDNKIIIEVA